MKSPIFKALCVAALLTPNFFHAMELPPSSEHELLPRKTVEVVVDNTKTKHALRIEQISAYDSPYVGIQPSNYIREIPPKKIVDLPSRVSFENNGHNQDLLKAKYKIKTTSEDFFETAIVAELNLDQQKKTLQGSISKNSAILDHSAIALNDNQQAIIYAILKIDGDKLENSKIAFSNQRPKVDKIESKQRTNIPKKGGGVPMFYIPGLIRWTPGK